MSQSKSRSIAILGAGIVGLSTALELQRRGYDVTLVERHQKMRNASYGNAGVVNPGSIFPVASPGVARRLPRLLFNQHDDIHFHYGHTLLSTRRIRHFLARCNTTSYQASMAGLYSLAKGARAQHEVLSRECRTDQYFTNKGWLHLFRTPRGFESSLGMRQALEQYGIGFDCVDKPEIAELEPGLKPIFHSGVLIRDAATCSDPGAISEALMVRFNAQGGTLVHDHVIGIQPADSGWWVVLKQGRIETWQLVIAMGVNSGDLLKSQGLDVPLYAERGYHQHFVPGGDHRLNRSIFDVESSYVMSPMQAGLRVTSGIEWAKADAKPTPKQLERIVPKARQAMELGDAVEVEPWLGCRPQTADSLPMIGQAKPGLWVNAGHGHMGFNLGPVSGKVLAQTIHGEEPEIGLTPYSPWRFQ